MRAIVLGAGAGGGIPQWNCGCEICVRARRGDSDVLARTQCGVAVSADGARWVLLNAPPELPQQINRTPALHPPPGTRKSPIAAVVLAGGEIDAILGLLGLREGHEFAIHAGPDVLRVLDENPIFGALPASRVPRRALPLGRATPVTDGAGEATGLTVEAFAVPGKVPLFAETGADPGRADDGVTVGLHVQGGGRSLFFIPGCAELTPDLRRRLQGADLVLFDGTLWHDAEMIEAGLGAKTGRRMGHMSMSGKDGTMAAFEGLGVRRRVFIHVNNSNKALLEHASERVELTAAGWEVATDGMELFA